jgi:hypothetical protein
MNDAVAATVGSTKAETDAGRRKALGEVVVRDYVGQTAAEAALAIRRAGLRPGLERAFGCEAERLGQVVAQEPATGSHLARSAMVTLYVGAPGSTPVDEEPVEHPTLSFEADPPFAPRDEASAAEAHVHPEMPRVRRRRKPRPSRGAPRILDTSPELAPVAAVVLADAAPMAELAFQEEASPAAADDDQLSTGGLEDGPRELQHDELVAHGDDMFAGRTGTSWRQVYPTRRQLTSVANQHQRRWSR